MMDTLEGPSAFSMPVISVLLEGMQEAEPGASQAGRDGAMFAIRLGDAIRLAEEAGGTAKQFDQAIVDELNRAPTEARERRQAMQDEALAEVSSEVDREYLDERLGNAKTGDDYDPEIDTLRDLLLADPTRWYEGDAFFALTGYSQATWKLIAQQSTAGLNAMLVEANPAEPIYPWQAVAELLRCGYVTRCGDAFTGYEPPLIQKTQPAVATG
jgi:hypothetical protein